MKDKHDQSTDIITAGTQGSALLQGLNKADLSLLLPCLRIKPVAKGMVLYEPGDAIEYAYFPCGPALISFMVFLKDGQAVEAAVIGREGAAGGIVSHGRLPAFCQFLVQSPGTVACISCADLQKAREKSVTLDNFFVRYADCLLAQMFQAVACSAVHSIEQRAAKWLAAAHDRTGSAVIPLTQDNIAELLGVGRSYVARVMAGLRSKGVLEVSRGKLTILDTKKLKKAACGCDELVQGHFSDVLAGSYAGGNGR